MFTEPKLFLVSGNAALKNNGVQFTFIDHEFIKKLVPNQTIKCIRGKDENRNIVIKTAPGYSAEAKAFNSQITFDVQIESGIKIIKLFKNGVVKISNGIREDLSDLYDSITTLTNYLNEMTEDGKISFDGNISVEMMNYKFSMKNIKLRIDLNLLCNHLKISLIKHTYENDDVKLIGFQRSEESKEGVMVSFYINKPNRVIKLKIFPINKINIFAVKNVNELHMILDLLNNIFENDYKNNTDSSKKFIYDAESNLIRLQTLRKIAILELEKAEVSKKKMIQKLTNE